jgi:hypothetical protein
MIEGIAQVVENAQGPGFKSKYQKKKLSCGVGVWEAPS